MAGYEFNYVTMSATPSIAFKTVTVSGVKGFYKVTSNMMPSRIQVDGDSEQKMDYTIVYAGDERIAQMPNAPFSRACWSST